MHKHICKIYDGSGSLLLFALASTICPMDYEAGKRNIQRHVHRLGSTETELSQRGNMDDGSEGK